MYGFKCSKFLATKTAFVEEKLIWVKFNQYYIQGCFTKIKV